MAINNRPSNTSSTYTLPIVETIFASWEKVSGSKKTFWAAFGIFFAIAFVSGFTLSFLKDAPHIIYSAVNVVVSIINILLQVGLLYVGILRARDESITYTQLFRAFDINFALNIIGLYIIQFLILLIPLLIVAVLCPIIILMTSSAVVITIGFILGVVGLLAIIS